MALKLDARKKRATLIVAIVVPMLFTAIAVPTLVGQARGPIAGVDDVVRGPSSALLDVAGVRADNEPSNAESIGAMAAAAAGVIEAAAEAAVAASDAPRLVPSIDGDLHVALELSSSTQHTASPVRATVTLRNLTFEEFHVPDRGEPQPTLTIVVVDAGGNEVRRVVESSEDQLPRHLRLLRSGDSLALDVSIVDDGEEGLATGTYRAYAEFASAPSWKLIGLPCYEEKAGAPRSEWTTFDVVD